MSKKFFRLISTLIVTAMVMTLAVACGNNTQSQDSQAAVTSAAVETKAADSTAEALKEVTLKFYFGGTKPSAFDQVWNKVSEASKDKLNAKFEVTYIPWGDLVNKIMVMAAAGDKWDLNFTADWIGYAQLLNTGAFKPLNDLLPKYAPDLYAQYTSQGTLDAATVDGNIMCLPWTMKQNMRPYFGWRSDLTPEIAKDSIKTIEDMDSVLTQAKAKFPTLKVLNIGVQNGFPYAIGEVTTLKYELASLSFHGFYFDMNDSKVTVVPFEQTQAFKEAVTYAKKWYDAGIIPQDAFIDKNDINKYLENGKTYSQPFSNEASEVNIKRGLSGVFPDKSVRLERSLLYPEKKYYNRTPLANVVTIGKNSENPERALMFCNLMETDKNFYDMVMYGIEGETYVLKGEEAVVPDGMDASNPNYLGWTSQWPFWKPQFMRPDPTYDKGFWNRQGEFASLPININSPVYGLFFNSDSVKTEISKRDQLQDEIAIPLLFGSVKNVEKEVANYIEQQKAAGADKIAAELQKQVDAYLAGKK